MPILVNCECGKQFQTSDANVGRQTLCPNCGRELVVPKVGHGMPGEAMYLDGGPTKTSGKAITSLVLGIGAFFCSLLAGIPAIIFGSLSLSDIGQSRGRLEGKAMAITGIVLGGIGTFFGLIVIPVMIALLLPAVQAAREAARRQVCVSNIRQIGLALHNYADAQGQFPPASIKDADGKPLLSWRVAILPYMEGQEGLYKQFKLDEPWDSPTNMPLAAQMPKLFFCLDQAPAPGEMTTYQAIVGPQALFDGKGSKLEEITDGTSNTIAVVEALTPVTWTRPDDVDIRVIPTSIGSKHPGGSNVLFADGSLKFLKKTTPDPILRGLCTKDGGEVIAADSY